MEVKDQVQSNGARLRAQLSAALADMMLANGTPLAVALFSALMVDLRRSQHPDGWSILFDMDDSQIVTLGANLLDALADARQAFDLPLGTRVQSDEIGSVLIGREFWVTDVARPGLFPLEATRRDAHGINLELLRYAISQQVRGKPWQRIGLPSPVFIVDSDARHLIQFPPFQPAGNVVLQRSASDTGASRFCSATPTQIEALATSIAVDMETLWKRRRLVAEQARDVRVLAENKIPKDAPGVAVRAIALDFEEQRADECLAFYVEYDGIDEAMRPGVVLDYIPAHITAWSMFNPVPSGISGRFAERDALRALGADGEIEEFAAAILRAAPEGQAAILARLTRDYEALVSFTTNLGELHAILFWRDGCIKAEVDVPGVFMKYHDWVEMYYGTYTEHEANELIGSSIASIDRLPFDIDAIIADANPLMDGGLKLRLHRPFEHQLVNCTTGQIWAR
ncbi:hypothetical protein SAMN05216382_3068 [Sphingomonas palmae]|uniref:Uncharacterized protein n=2 Tax=Sphingomonas palmae TaxID=1855283 RepID=A0A1H7UTN7_9SPHN|nr:hypothetical protein SAMN05216382_3068 [Sphingomonas palmae]